MHFLHGRGFIWLLIRFNPNRSRDCRPVSHGRLGAVMPPFGTAAKGPYRLNSRHSSPDQPFNINSDLLMNSTHEHPSAMNRPRARNGRKGAKPLLRPTVAGEKRQASSMCRPPTRGVRRYPTGDSLKYPTSDPLRHPTSRVRKAPFNPNRSLDSEPFLPAVRHLACHFVLP